MNKVDLHLINHAFYCAERYSNIVSDMTRGSTAEDARRDIRLLEDSKREFSKLQSVWSDFQQFILSKEKSYDNFVTHNYTHAESCSCHINPPCSFCLNRTDEDIEA